jgi:hypothetical protein
MGLTEGFLQYGKSWFELTQDERLWFPHLVPNKEWKNRVSEDWNNIYEEKTGNESMGPLQDKFHNKNIKRYTFAKYKNAFGETYYRFIGVFRFREKNDETCIYEKTSDELNLGKAKTVT